VADLTGGELVARVLARAGVGHVFTLCGGHILPIYDGCLKEGIGVVDLRHEQAAAHAADAYARLTRNVGVAIVTAGPGVTDAVTGVANAFAARSPLLLIGGAAPLGLRGLGALQEMEQVALLRPITKGAWSVAETRQIPEVLTTAIRAALSGRPGPVFVEIPVDLLLTTIEDRLAPIPADYVHRTPAPGDPAAIERLAGLLEGASRPVVIAGSGVWWDDAAGALAAFAAACRPGIHWHSRTRVAPRSARPTWCSCSARPSTFVSVMGGRRRSRRARPSRWWTAIPPSSAAIARWPWASPVTSAACSISSPARYRVAPRRASTPGGDSS
jgi:thiamine pyrophosphate-dependent acetolactate synthase large subunit-like protein